MCTALVPEIGYDSAAKIAKVAYESGRTVREVAMEISGLDKKKINELLDPQSQTDVKAPRSKFQAPGKHQNSSSKRKRERH
jgi:fumarate hydratase class II